MAEIPEVLKDSPFGPDKLYLSIRAYIILIQSFFSAWDRFRWDADPTKTKIIVTKNIPYTPTTENKLPLVIVSGSPASWRASSPNPMMQQDPLGPAPTREFTDLIDSGVIIYAIAENDVEAGILGWNIFNLIPTFREEAKRLGGMDFIDNGLTLSNVFDAASLIKGAHLGQWWGVSLQNRFHIGQTNTVIGQPVLENAVAAIRLQLG